MADVALTEAVGERIEQLAQKAGYTRDDLATRAGIHRVRLDEVLDGEVWPCPRTLQRLARALDTIPAQLIPRVA